MTSKTPKSEENKRQEHVYVYFDTRDHEYEQLIVKLIDPMKDAYAKNNLKLVCAWKQGAYRAEVKDTVIEQTAPRMYDFTKKSQNGHDPEKKTLKVARFKATIYGKSNLRRIVAHIDGGGDISDVMGC